MERVADNDQAFEADVLMEQEFEEIVEEEQERPSTADSGHENSNVHKPRTKPPDSPVFGYLPCFASRVRTGRSLQPQTKAVAHRLEHLFRPSQPRLETRHLHRKFTLQENVSN